MPRNKSEIRPSWQAELIAFAHVSVAMNHLADYSKKECPIRAARDALSPEANAHYPKRLTYWSEVAEHIFETYGKA